MLVIRSRGNRGSGKCSMGIEFEFCKVKIMEMFRNNVNILNIVNCIVKMVKVVFYALYFCVFFNHNKNGTPNLKTSKKTFKDRKIHKLI